MKLIILFTILALPVFFWSLSSFITRERELSGQATVAAHRIAQRAEMPKGDARWVGNWNYLVTFTLSDGEEIELYTIQEDFRNLTDGTSGWLTWQGKRFLRFEPET